MAEAPPKARSLPGDSSLKEAELALKVTKEIVIKFIEMGKVTPSSFEDAFLRIHSTVTTSLKSHLDPGEE